MNKQAFDAAMKRAAEAYAKPAPPVIVCFPSYYEKYCAYLRELKAKQA